MSDALLLDLLALWPRQIRRFPLGNIRKRIIHAVRALTAAQGVLSSLLGQRRIGQGGRLGPPIPAFRPPLCHGGQPPQSSVILPAKAAQEKRQRLLLVCVKAAQNPQTTRTQRMSRLPTSVATTARQHCRRASCQLELRRSLLLLLLIAGTAIDQVPCCLALDEPAGLTYEQAAAVDDAVASSGAADDKRGGARAFLPAANQVGDKRGGARAFVAPADKRAGARAFQQSAQLQPLAFDLKKRDAAGSSNAFYYFHPDEKRGGARPFFGSGFFGGDGTWKRGGGRFFFRQFADSSPGFVGGSWVKRAGGRHFSMKRGGGRAFFGGGMDSLFDPSNYWAPQRYAPIAKYPRRSLSPLEPAAIVDEEEDIVDDEQQSPPFYYTNNHNFDGRANGKRGGARAFNGGDDGGMLGAAFWEKRAGGRMFNGGN